MGAKVMESSQQILSVKGLVPYFYLVNNYKTPFDPCFILSPLQYQINNFVSNNKKAPTDLHR